MKTKEEIAKNAVRDWKLKEKADENWFKCRIEGAWESGYANAQAQDAEIVKAVKKESYDKGYKDGADGAWINFSGWTPKTLDEATQEAYDRGVKDGAALAAMHGSDATSKDLEKSFWQGVDVGLEKAWETAKKIVLDTEDGGMSSSELLKRFGTRSGCVVLRDYAVKDALKRLSNDALKLTNAQKFEQVFGFNPKDHVNWLACRDDEGLSMEIWPSSMWDEPYDRTKCE